MSTKEIHITKNTRYLSQKELQNIYKGNGHTNEEVADAILQYRLNQIKEFRAKNGDLLNTKLSTVRP